jgi:hypothetical protein
MVRILGEALVPSSEGWCGKIWYGTGMLRCGVLWCGSVWSGVLRHGVDVLGMVSRRAVRRGLDLHAQGASPSSEAWLGKSRLGTVGHGRARRWSGMAW